MNRAETLQQLAWVCRNGRTTLPPAAQPSGWAPLDAVLPGGGWQAGTIVELMPAQTGIGELSLLMPTLARLTRADRYVALIAPPYIPFAPALAQHAVQLARLLIVRAQKAEDILWATEQTLRCSSFGAVLAWPLTIRDRDTRRLQLAAEAGRSTGFVYRSAKAALEASPAAVRLKLQSHPQGGVEIDIVKCRGARAGMSVRLADLGRRPESGEHDARHEPDPVQEHASQSHASQDYPSQDHQAQQARSASSG